LPAYRTQAVVLRSLDFGESDKIVSFFTRNFGKIRGMAKSAKKSRKRFGAALEPGTLGLLDFFDKPNFNLKRINSMEITHPLTGIWSNFSNILRTSYLTCLVDEFLPDEHKNIEVFDLLTFFINFFNNIETSEGHLRIFEIRLLKACGLQPNLDVCSVCGAKWDARYAMEFSAARGGIVCANCQGKTGGTLPLGPGTGQFLRNSLELDLENVSRLHFTPQANRESRQIIGEFIKYQLDRDIRANRVLEQCLAR
jgi:DNA repair protein RecO (recombination protein O)